MTGFGCGEYTDEQTQITLEIKTVNHRYKDFNIRMPRRYAQLEERLRRQIADSVVRGRIEVNVKVQLFQSDDINIHYNRELASKYLNILEQIRTDFPDIEDDIRISSISRFPDVVSVEEVKEDLDAFWGKMSQALNTALDQLEQSRCEEGRSLEGDFAMRIGLVRELLTKIGAASDDIPRAYGAQLKKNLENYELGNIDEQRLLTEIAIYAERCNITEEIVRLGNHLDSFEKNMQGNNSVGRKLDFTLQEINREANTIASKSNSAPISAWIIEIKSELEKMREQIQNIE